MQIFTISLLCVLSAPFAAKSAGILPITSRQEGGGRGNAFERDSALLDRALTLQEQIASRGCATDVCFALDGSASVGQIEFERAKEFAQVIAVIASTDPRARHGAVQFGLTNVAVANLTSNTTKFVSDVAASLFANAPRTFTGAGVLGCGRIVRDVAPASIVVRGSFAAIIIISDGGSNFGANPARVVNEFFVERPNAAVLAIGIGNADRGLLENIAPNGNRFVDLARPSLLPEATKATINFICQL